MPTLPLLLVAIGLVGLGCARTEESAAPSASERQQAPSVAAEPAGQAVVETVEEGTIEAAALDEILVFIENDVDEGKAPLTVTFEVELEGGRPPITWRWDYGDGQTSDTVETMHRHVFGKPGRYTVELEVTDADGVSDFDLTEVTVTED